MIPAGIAKRIPRTDPVGIANDDDIPKIYHSLFSIPTIPLVCDKVEGGQPATYEWSVGSYVRTYG